MAEPKLGDPSFIWIPLTPEEAEILCGALANTTPDKTNEIIVYFLYKRIEASLTKFLSR